MTDVVDQFFATDMPPITAEILLGCIDELRTELASVRLELGKLYDNLRVVELDNRNLHQRLGNVDPVNAKRLWEEALHEKWTKETIKRANKKMDLSKINGS